MSRLAHDVKQKKRTEDVVISENVDFSGLLLSDHVSRGLKNSGFVRPSPIQLKAIPLGRCGLDLIVQAKSGTGKTCVFSVVALENIQTDSSSTQVLVLAPTREIAVQIWEVICGIGSAMPGLKCHTFIGGLPLHEDRVKLKRCHIAVGSPGRIKQLIQCEALRTESIRLFVLDEADKLLEESFQDQINWIYSTLPENKQMLALSATYPEYLADHLTAYMRNPTFLRLNISDPALLGIRQYYHAVPYHPMSHVVFEEKSKVLSTILSSVSFQQCLVFSNLQTRAQNLADSLTSKGWPTACIAGCLDQKERNAAMARLKTYKCRILISTDLTSRGIDADKVNLVVNMDIPKDHETYLHRIGRAGRFGSFGVAITLISDGQEKMDLDSVEKRCNTQIYKLPDPIPSDLAKPGSPIYLDDVVSSEVINTDRIQSDRRPEKKTDTRDEVSSDLQGCGGSNIATGTDEPTGVAVPTVNRQEDENTNAYLLNGVQELSVAVNSDTDTKQSCTITEQKVVEYSTSTTQDDSSKTCESGHIETRCVTEVDQLTQIGNEESPVLDDDDCSIEQKEEDAIVCDLSVDSNKVCSPDKTLVPSSVQKCDVVSMISEKSSILSAENRTFPTQTKGISRQNVVKDIEVEKLSLTDLFFQVQGCKTNKAPHSYDTAKKSLKTFLLNWKGSDTQKLTPEHGTCARLLPPQTVVCSTTEKLLKAVTSLQKGFTESDLNDFEIETSRTALRKDDTGTSNTKDLQDRCCQCNLGEGNKGDSFTSFVPVNTFGVTKKSNHSQPLSFSTHVMSDYQNSPDLSQKSSEAKEQVYISKTAGEQKTLNKPIRRPRKTASFAVGHMMEQFTEGTDSTDQSPQLQAVEKQTLTWRQPLTETLHQETSEKEMTKSKSKTDTENTSCVVRTNDLDTRFRELTLSANKAKADNQFVLRKDSGSTVDPLSERSSDSESEDFSSDVSSSSSSSSEDCTENEIDLFEETKETGSYARANRKSCTKQSEKEKFHKQEMSYGASGFSAPWPDSSGDNMRNFGYFLPGHYPDQWHPGHHEQWYMPTSQYPNSCWQYDYMPQHYMYPSSMYPANRYWSACYPYQSNFQVSGWYHPSWPPALSQYTSDDSMDRMRATYQRQQDYISSMLKK